MPANRRRKHRYEQCGSCLSRVPGSSHPGPVVSVLFYAFLKAVLNGHGEITLVSLCRPVHSYDLILQIRKPKS